MSLRAFWGFLHVQDVRGAVFDELRAMAEEGPEHAHFIVGPEGAGQEAEGMKLLQPLGVVVVRLSAGHDFEVARIDQVDTDVGRLEHLVDRNPIDAGGFHRDGIDVVGEQPRHQLREIGGEGGERTDDGQIAVGREGGDDLGTANVETGRVRKDGRQMVDSETFGLGHRHGLPRWMWVSQPDCEGTVAY